MSKKIKDIVIFKGKKAKSGPVHTRNIVLDDIREIFFPKDFNEKYGYLGSVPWNEGGNIFKAMEPLVIFMDYKAKPWWCPRWFLRFLHLFGSDKSIVRVRNRWLHDLQNRITGGFLIWDYKTKWSDYDLRISISGTQQMESLKSAIAGKFYEEGHRDDLIQRIKELDPEAKIVNTTISSLEKRLEELEDKIENHE